MNRVGVCLVATTLLLGCGGGGATTAKKSSAGKMESVTLYVPGMNVKLKIL